MNFDVIYSTWKFCENNCRKDLIVELDRLVLLCDNLKKIYEKYTVRYLEFLSISGVRFGSNKILIKILSVIKENSPEAYLFLTDGNDVLNLKKFVEFKDASEIEKIVYFSRLSDFSKYLRYAFLKLLNEKNEEKKKQYLKGLLGIV